MASAKPRRYEEVSLEIRDFMSSSRVYISRNILRHFRQIQLHRVLAHEVCVIFIDQLLTVMFSEKWVLHIVQIVSILPPISKSILSKNEDLKVLLERHLYVHSFYLFIEFLIFETDGRAFKGSCLCTSFCSMSQRTCCMCTDVPESHVCIALYLDRVA